MLTLIKIEAFAVLRQLGQTYNRTHSARGRRGYYERGLRPLSRYVYANYLLWWLGERNYLFKAPSLSKVSGLPIPVPSLDEQKAIFIEVDEILSQIDKMEGYILTNGTAVNPFANPS